MTCLVPVLRYRWPDDPPTLAELPAILLTMEARIRELEGQAKVAPSPAIVELVDAAEAGRMLGMTAAAVRAAARRGTLKAIHVGRRVRFSRSTLT